MNSKTLSNNRSLARRTLLRGSAGVSIALPWFSSMVPAFGREASLAAALPRRFVGISNALGFHGPNLFPEKSGRDYEVTRYLKPIEDLRDEFTIISGASHPGVGGGHKAEPCILSAAPYSGSNSRNTISLDEVMARKLGGDTRHPSLVLSSNGTTSTSYTANISLSIAKTTTRCQTSIPRCCSDSIWMLKRSPVPREPCEILKWRRDT